jgi:4-amino-4-deoxychorismate lyase
MYSSWVGGIVTDAAAMNVPLDDHLVHRGHGVFDTATLADGRVYRLHAHLDRLERSAAGARVPLLYSRERLEQIVLQTAAASGRRDGSIRYWASVGPGDFSFLPDGCVCVCRRSASPMCHSSSVIDGCALAGLS